MNLQLVTASFERPNVSSALPGIGVIGVLGHSQNPNIDGVVRFIGKFGLLGNPEVRCRCAPYLRLIGTIGISGNLGVLYLVYSNLNSNIYIYMLYVHTHNLPHKYNINIYMIHIV